MGGTPRWYQKDTTNQGNPGPPLPQAGSTPPVRGLGWGTKIFFAGSLASQPACWKASQPASQLNRDSDVSEPEARPLYHSCLCPRPAGQLAKPDSQTARRPARQPQTAGQPASQPWKCGGLGPSHFIQFFPLFLFSWPRSLKQKLFANNFQTIAKHFPRQMCARMRSLKPCPLYTSTFPPFPLS